MRGATIRKTSLWFLSLVLAAAFVVVAVRTSSSALLQDEPAPSPARLRPVEAGAGTTTIEVDIQGTLSPAQKAVVPTAKPTVVITRAGDIPANFTVRLTRPDGRAGFGGAGKSLSVGASGSGADLEETGPATGVYSGSPEILVGVNTIRIQDAGGVTDLLTATMLVFTPDYEDINGNGLLDTGEDLNHNGVLDDGEDVNGNETLELTEDFNENGVLDPGEDINGNEFLDLNEDVNGNGQLDTDEDLNGNSALDPGEDLNGNGLLDLEVVLPIDALLDDTRVPHPDGFDEHATSIILHFLPNATAVDAGGFLRGTLGTNPFDLRPVGLSVDSTSGMASLVVTAEIIGGPVPHEVSRTLHGQLAGDFLFPPPVPPPFPLRYATVNGYFSGSTVAGERLPARLVGGAAPNAGEGYEFAGANGGFDNDGEICNFDDDGDGAVDEDPVDGVDNDGDGNFDEDSPDPCDELDTSWHHFFLQTYAAHRLIDVVGFAGAPLAVGVIDTGFGNGSPALPDVGAGRIRLPHNHAPQFLNPAGPKPNLRRIQDNQPAAGSPHGTFVAELSSGDGTMFSLGTGRRSPLRPIRTNFSWASLNNSLLTAGADAGTAVVSCSWRFTVPAASAAAGRNRVRLARANLWAGLTAVFAQGQVAVICSGNEAEDTERAMPALFTVPNLAGTPIDDDLDGATDEDPFDGVDNDLDGVVDEDPAEQARAVCVGATGLVNLPIGQEQYASSFSNTGQRVSVSAPGQAVVSVQPGAAYSFSSPIFGCSFATPLVSGAITELINMATTLPAGLFSGGGVTVAQRNRRVAQIVLATGDDLGNTGGAAAADHVNNDPGNGPDTNFGLGRMNMWKAALSVVNQGLAAQHGRDIAGGAPNGFDDRFTDIPTINDANTLWYGFEIITSERHATVWIDGVKQMDAGATTPNGPDIIAYKGMRSDLPMLRGVHDRTDGSSEDLVAGARPGVIVEEDPTVGIVPIGTRRPNRGMYVMTFSIQRSDLYDANGLPRTLSLRRRGFDVLDRPIFNLRLETNRMRSGEVSGVSFDDFVFQIAPPDYGDAKIAPTLMKSERGARHEDSTLEWLGKLSAPNLDSVTPEHNANRELTGGDSRVDVDGVENRLGAGADLQFHDRDGRDDGVLFFPLTYKPGPGNPGRVQFTIGVFDKDDARYAADPEHSLFVNLWIDWNTNGMWEEVNSEHVLNGLQINPRGAAGINWSIVRQSIPGGSSSVTTQILSGADPNNADTATFESMIPVGDIGCDVMWARMRLDYGEDVGRNDPRPQFRSLPSLRDPTLADGTSQPVGAMLGYVHGAARYGEVEDYLLGTDFGDAPDPFTGPGKYPTKKLNKGARHLDVHQEWLGPDNNDRPDPTREIDAKDLSCTAAGGTDEDKRPNLDPADTDLKCNGVLIPPIVPGAVINIDVTVTSSVSARGAVFFVANGSAAGPGSRNVGVPDDAADSLPRYSVGDPLRRLYLSGWADWNGDGVWAAGEKIINDILNPQFFGADGLYTLGEAFTDDNFNGVHDDGENFIDDFGVDTATFTYPVAVPANIADEFWFRFRLAYGEDERTVDIEVKENDEGARVNREEKGGALFGEVEDYPVKRPPPDWHATWIQIPTDTIVDFSTGVIPIPADFFGPGSDPFTGQVPMRGLPTEPSMGDSSVCLQRPRDPVPPVDTVPIEIIALSLVSTDPIPISYGNSGDIELWTVNVELSPTVTPPRGSLTAMQTSDNGGTFSTGFYIQPLLTFTRLADGAVRALDSGASPSAKPLFFTGSGDYVNSVDPSLGILVPEGAGWVSGVSDSEGTQTVVPFTVTTTEIPPTVRHTVCPPRRPPPPDWHATWGSGPSSNFVDFSTGEIPIPAGFFGPGSDPFTGTVPLTGVPRVPSTGDSSVCLQRTHDPLLPNETVPIEIVQLNLASSEPITVTYDDGNNPENWEFTVGLSPTVTPPLGQVISQPTNPNGGQFSAQFSIMPVLTFHRVSDNAVRVADLGMIPNAQPLVFVGSGNYVNQVNPELGILTPPDAHWISGVRDDGFGNQVIAPFTMITTSEPPTVVHTVCPPRRIPFASLVPLQPTVTAGTQAEFDLTVSGWDPSLLNALTLEINSGTFSNDGPGALSPDPALSAIDINRNDYVFAGLPSVANVDTASPDFQFLASLGLTSIGVPDPGLPRYAGTLVFGVPPEAQGSFSIDFRSGPGTVLIDSIGDPITPLGRELGLLSVTPICVGDVDCDDADACTLDVCDVESGECFNVVNFAEVTSCCDPNDGTVVPLDDGSSCTEDSCSLGEARGVAVHTPFPAGEHCEDGDICTTDDVCDGKGLCQSGPDVREIPCEIDADCPPESLGCGDSGFCTCGECSDTPSVSPDPSGLQKSRFVSFTLSNGTSDCVSAIRVRLTSLHHVDPPYTGGSATDFSAFEGQVRWVGPPMQFVESVSNGTPFAASLLQCDPYYQDWSTLGLLHVYGSAIVPSSVYEVEAVAATCLGVEEGCTSVSASLDIGTTRWGDVVTPFNPPSATSQPDFTDIGALVNKFKSALGAPIKARALIAGTDINGVIDPTPDLNFTHIAACVDAFKGLPYPYMIATCP